MVRSFFFIPSNCYKATTTREGVVVDPEQEETEEEVGGGGIRDRPAQQAEREREGGAEKNLILKYLKQLINKYKEMLGLAAKNKRKN